MKAAAAPGGMERAIAAIIDPDAFAIGADEKVDTIIARRRDALRKAAQIVSMDFLLQDLPTDLRGAAQLLDEMGVTVRPCFDDGDIVAAAAEAFPDLRLYPDRPVHGGLIKPLGDGSLMVIAMVPKPADPNGSPGFAGARFEGDQARRLGAEIDVALAGGGHA